MANFDERMELFLKGKMNQEEEKDLFEDLKRNPDLEDRAKVMALAIDRMKESGRASDNAIVEKIKETDQETLEELAGIKRGG
jgi:polyhydroxyalkanoate synthesis regulator phasin